jgi:LytS/YehU family sensor histidine kinase
LSNIRRRLETLYPGQHVLRISNPADGGGEIFIQIPLSHEIAESLDAEAYQNLSSG